MTQQDEIASLSLGDLRDRLQARIDDLDRTDDIDLLEALRYLTALPDHAHTPDSVGALIELAKNFYFAVQPMETLQAVSLASRLATKFDQKLLLSKARSVEAIVLCDLGRFTESTVAHVESWTLARMLGDIEREIVSTQRAGRLCAAMAQWDVASVYYRRARELAAEYGSADFEFESRNFIAWCAVQLRDPASGLGALLPFTTRAPETKLEMLSHANAHDTLAHLYLLMDELNNAKAHAQESGRLVKLTGVKRTTQLYEALLGLIDVKSGAVESGLAAVEHALAFAKRVDHTHLPDHLSMCVDAYEAAGRSDRALAYLQELVAWKQKSIDAEMPLQFEGLTESLQFETGTSVFDDNLRIRAHVLQAGVGQRIQHFLETAINAEIASGHDLYRTFRLAKLARCLAASIGWEEERIAPLALGAQLCNIGMTAIPARIAQKPRGLSDSERHVLRIHTQYGAELLAKSNLRMLEVAGTIAEQHHERYDGSGYPHGLSGEAITAEARIIAICDAFDAMTHRRPWRRTPLSIQAALHELKQGMGTQFDPSFVDAFVDLIRREFWEHDDFDAFLAEGAHEVDYVRVRARMEAMIADEGESRAQAA